MGKKGGKKNGRRGGTVHGKTPFGTKAKKKQLQERRARKAERPTGRFAADPASSAAAHHGDDDPGAGEGDGDSAGDGGGTLVGAFGVALGEGQNTLTSLFYKESDRDVARRREAGNAPLAYGPDGARDAGPSHGVCPSFYTTMEFLPHPRRPAWSASSSRSQLEADERAYFKAWLAETAAASRSGPHARDATPFFEQNLEVWRQLWRVLERSDVVLLVADVRCPLFYIPIPLIRHIGEGGFKCQRVVVVLTKCDLVSPEAAQRWQDYLTAQVPGIATVQTFSTRGGSGGGGDGDGGGGGGEGGEGGGKGGGGSEKAAASEGITSRRKRFRRPGFKRDHPLIQCQVRRILAACTDGLALPPAVEGASVGADVGEGGDGSETGGEGTEGYGGVDGEGKTGTIGTLGTPGTLGTLGTPGTERRSITIGLVGTPNVGKTSLLNGIVGRKVAGESATAGHTKHLQTMRCPDEALPVSLLEQGVAVEMCDCPGLVFPMRGVPRHVYEVRRGTAPLQSSRVIVVLFIVIEGVIGILVDITDGNYSAHLTPAPVVLRVLSCMLLFLFPLPSSLVLRSSAYVLSPRCEITY